MPDKFRLDWYAGPSAQVELFSPRPEEGGVYQMKYTPPFRTTIRPPVDPRPLGKEELAPINSRLAEVVEALSRPRGGADARGDHSNREALEKMKIVGQQLLQLLIPYRVQSDLQTGGLFLEIGMDEGLLNYPWELTHDGDSFLCLKHAMGRFVNGARVGVQMLQRPESRLGEELDELKMLLISVPNPQPRDADTKYERLTEAEAETRAICETLCNQDGVHVDLLKDDEATWDGVFKALQSGQYQIIHFNGHAHYDDANPRQSGLVLWDQDLGTGAVVGWFGRSAPILCFVNACETAKVARAGESRYDVYGLARAFLDTGAYLIGSRWKIDDEAAAICASEFYRSLILESESVGRALQKARKRCLERPDIEALGWASYVLYGDPRVCFRRTKA